MSMVMMETYWEYLIKYQYEFFFLFIIICLFGWSLIRKLMGCMLVLVMLVIGLLVGGYYFLFSENGSSLSGKREEIVEGLNFDKFTKDGVRDLLDYLTSQVDDEKIRVEEIVDLAQHLKHQTEEREALIRLLAKQKESGYFE